MVDKEPVPKAAPVKVANLDEYSETKRSEPVEISRTKGESFTRSEIILSEKQH